MPMITKAIIYTRFSPRPNAAECESSAHQEERCRAYCRKMGYQIADVLGDPEVSGGVLNRPGLSDAIRAIKDIADAPGDPDLRAVVLVVDAADRLARDMLVSLTVRHEIEKAGGRIEYANGTPTDDTPEGKLFSNILAAFASYERDRVRYATSRGMKRRQENGEWFGKPPIGFMLDPECRTRLIPSQREQDALKAARQMRVSPCLSWDGVAVALYERFGPFRGGPWKADTIRKALAKEEKQ